MSYHLILGSDFFDSDSTNKLDGTQNTMQTQDRLLKPQITKMRLKILVAHKVTPAPVSS